MTEAAPVRTRPRDRRSHITRAAVDAFAARGFHAVQMCEVAEAVGITAPAIYRHFPNKRALLADVVLEAVTDMRAAVAAARTRSGPPDHALAEVIATLAAGAVGAHHGVTTLWKREGRALPEGARGRLRGLLQTINTEVAGALTAVRPDLAAADAPEDARHRWSGPAGGAAAGSDADLLARAVVAVTTCLSHHRLPEPADRTTGLLRAMAHAVAVAELPPAPSQVPGAAASRPAETVVDGAPASTGRPPRREELLAAAARLFRERGYADVSVADLGAAVSVTGPSVYAHFASKREILAVLLARTVESLALATGAALAAAAGPDDAVDRLLRGYTGFALAHTDLLSVSLTEVALLPEAARPDIHRARRDFITEWIGAVRRLRPGLDATAARVRVYGAMSVINDLVQVRALRERGDLDECLIAVGRAVLTAAS